MPTRASVPTVSGFGAQAFSLGNTLGALSRPWHRDQSPVWSFRAGTPTAFSKDCGETAYLKWLRKWLDLRVAKLYASFRHCFFLHGLCICSLP